MNVNKININQSEPTYDIAADAYNITYEDSNVGEKLSELEQEQIQGGVYDISAHNNDATFASLSALFSDENLSTLIPSVVRCGGMSIRFV